MHRIDARRRRQWYRTGKRICETALLFEAGVGLVVGLAHVTQGPVDPMTVVGLLVVTPLVVSGALVTQEVALTRSVE